MSNSEQARNYIFGQMQKVKGFLSPLDGLLLSSMTIYQNNQGWGGPIAEIGVYQGRTYYLFRKTPSTLTGWNGWADMKFISIASLNAH